MSKKILQCGNKTLDLTNPVVMGILNLNPGSFSEVGRYSSPQIALSYCIEMVEQGAAIIDVGAEPTNPGVNPIISLQQELDYLLPVLESLCGELPVPISVDTSKPEVMQEAIKLGVNFLNDVRALQNPKALQVAVDSKLPVCLMHMAFPDGKISSNFMNRDDTDIVITVRSFLKQRIDACVRAGFSREKIIIDPGFGAGSFGKTTQQSLTLLNRLDELASLDLPILVGLSRKTFIGDILNAPADKRLAGSLAAATVAVLKGATIIRAHDVKATVDAIAIANALRCNTVENWKLT